MELRRCAACQKGFRPRAQVPDQLYCSAAACQAERRCQWQRTKRASDPDYKDNQARAQRSWKAKRPQYWREYRDAHPEYVERNRAQQRVRNALCDISRTDVVNWYEDRMRNCASALMRPPVHHQMPITIFYSWQLDLPAEVGKQFIHDALVAAVNRVAGDLKLEEAERPVVDHDTKDVLGDPKIIDIILEKIRAADVVVFDTTLTGRTVDGKKSVINSNVAYELGHAHQMHGHGVVLKVMNTFYGAAKRLPFDIQERRHPVTFTLDPKADAAAREKVLQDFVGELADILAQYVKARTPPPAPFERTPSNGNPAVYWRDGDPLVDLGRRQLTAPVTAPMVYLRLSPGTALPPFTGIQIADRVFTHARPLIGEAVPHSNSRNDYGMIHWFRPETRRDDGEDLPDLFAWTQVFRNREIWGINAMHLHAVWNQQIVMDHVERTLIDGLQDYLTKAEAFDYPASVHFEAGIVYVRGMRVSLANGGLRSEPLREHFISHEARFDRRDPAAAKAALLALFDRIFDEAAQHRPKNLGGFPGV